MLDIDTLRTNPEYAEQHLARRGFDININEEVLTTDSIRRGLSQEITELRTRRNQISEQLKDYYSGNISLSDDEILEIKDLATGLRTEVQDKEQEHREIHGEFLSKMLSIPNLPAEHAPTGLDYEDFELQYTWGDKPFIENPVDHSIIGANLRIIDTELGTQIAGPRFSVLRGKGAKLQRALINFFLDNNAENGYEEHVVPYVVNEKSLTGTGQLPKFKHDVFSTSVDGKEMYLSPTAEVQLTNLIRDKLLDEEELPFKITGYSENFRAEAGSAGRDTAGIFRQHQFPKIELVRVTTPEESWEQLESLTLDAEFCLRTLGLHYRKVALSTGDLGFSSAFTYDLEVWLPGQGNYREVSSCSNFTDFQARRLNAKVRRTPDNRKEFVHTVNGSSLAVGRTIVAILEQGLQPDGTVKMPEALQEYTKFSTIEH